MKTMADGSEEKPTKSKVGMKRSIGYESFISSGS